MLKSFAALSAKLTKNVSYRYVGTKHSETVQYDLNSCKQFDLLLKESENTSVSQMQENSSVSRMFLGCLFSRIIGSNFPLSIYLSQQIKYLMDISQGDSLIGEVEVVKDLGRSRYELKTICKTTEGKLVMEGKAIILQQ